ncbi:MAG: hypothetical protein KGH71_02135 [Candidatus Micrarchaeota archaeon]|nr:hypothetical protein [Candidatus Micrarchaeota archaeon]
MSLKPKPSKITLYQSLDFIPGMTISQSDDVAKEAARRIPPDEPFTALSVMQLVQDAKELYRPGSVEQESINGFLATFRMELRAKWPRSSF